jgi:hypothetical protein
MTLIYWWAAGGWPCWCGTFVCNVYFGFSVYFQPIDFIHWNRLTVRELLKFGYIELCNLQLNSEWWMVNDWLMNNSVPKIVAWYVRPGTLYKHTLESNLLLLVLVWALQQCAGTKHLSGNVRYLSWLSDFLKFLAILNFSYRNSYIAGFLIHLAF